MTTTFLINGEPFDGITDIQFNGARYPGHTKIVEIPELGKYPPRLERERFSGGVNLSAQARNRRRMEEARVFYTFEGKILMAPWLAKQFREALR